MESEPETVQISSDELHRRYVGLVNQATSCLCATTLTSRFGELVESLGDLESLIVGVKRWANSDGQAELADQMLGSQCVLAALRFEAEMWRALRAELPHDAWGHFVDAEEHAGVALRIPVVRADMENFFRGRYRALQKLLFPKMSFQSAGYNHDEGKCTICHELMSSCSHIKGFIYAGQVCAEYGFQCMEADHVALVDHPLDKRCYIRKYSEDGGKTWLDCLTGESTTSDMDSSTAEEDGFLAQGAFLSSRLPVGALL